MLGAETTLRRLQQSGENWFALYEPTFFSIGKSHGVLLTDLIDQGVIMLVENEGFRIRVIENIRLDVDNFVTQTSL